MKIIFIVFVVILGVLIAEHIGYYRGARDVAAGQLVCKLMQSADQTTFWRCEDVQ